VREQQEQITHLQRLVFLQLVLAGVVEVLG
jgi:hypothetical protein